MREQLWLGYCREQLWLKSQSRSSGASMVIVMDRSPLDPLSTPSRSHFTQRAI
jgi:hypothetical protein